MTWTFPVSGGPIPAANERILYDHHYLRNGSGFKLAPGAPNTDWLDYDWAEPVCFSTVDAGGNGQVQMRIVAAINVTAVGTGVTSFNLRTQAWVQAALSNTGVIGTNIPLFTPSALAGALTTGWKQFDSNWLPLASLATNVAGWGWTILRPRYRWDHNGSVAPTVANASVTLLMRIA